MKILIAPNAFKHSVTAYEASIAIQKGLLSIGSDITCEVFPIADGGDGTGDLIIKKLEGDFVNTTVHDALGREIETSFGLIDKCKTAVIEMAKASGIHLLKSGERKPLLASSFGTGELIKAALVLGVNKIILGMGGSATVDGGVGILQAMGINFLDKNGKTLVDLPKDLELLSVIDLSNLDKRILDCELVVLCDVNNKFLGENGAAAVFAPQKGATPKQVEQLESALSHFAKVTLDQTGVDMTTIRHGGAAGGAAAGLFAFLNAKLVDGIIHFLKFTDFESSLKNADLLITGEGCLDAQTLEGKAPLGVAKLAKEYKIPVVAMTGEVSLEHLPQLKNFFDVILPINHQAMELSEALPLTAENLSRTAAELGSLLKLFS